MSELFSIAKLTEPTNLAFFFSICCVVTYALTSIIKPLTRSLIKNKDLRTSITQATACGIGAFAGYEISSYATLGAWLGFGSGALNVVVISYLKNRLKSTNINLPAQDTPEHKITKKPSKDEDDIEY